MANEPQRTLWCLIKGDSTPFEVTAPAHASIDRLKALVWERAKNGVLRGTDAKDLALWQLNVPEPMAPPAGLARRIALRGDLARCAVALAPGDTVVEAWPDAPVARSVHVVAEPPFVGGKRKREDSVDVTGDLLARWSNLATALPTCPRDLAAYFSRPLEEGAKVPLSQRAMSSVVSRGGPQAWCSEADLGRLFRPSEDEESDWIWTTLKPALMMDAPDSAGGFISFWDRNIRQIIALLDVPCTFIRGDPGTSTRSHIPDFGVVLQGACVVWGAEKAPGYTGRRPKDELRHRFTWTYDPAPWILGYHAVGAEVTLSAIYPSTIDDLSTLDLSYKTRRIDHIIRMIKLAPLLRLLQRAIGRRDCPEFTRVTCETGTIVEIGTSCIKKTYTGADRHARIAHLRTVYALLRQKDVPNVDSALNLYDDAARGAVAYLRPKGVNRLPASPQEVLDAVSCLLAALVVLHAAPAPVFHRDIRWPNVVLSPAHRAKWVLVDWDDAAVPPTRAAGHLDPRCHAPAAFRDGHGAEVDVWAVGRLILDAREFVRAVPDALVAVGAQMVDGRIGTAEEAQVWIGQLAM